LVSPAVRAAVAGRDAQGLAFHGDDVGFGWRADDAQRNGFGDGIDQERAAGVRGFRQGRKIFEHAEEVRRLDHDRRGPRKLFGRQRRAIDLP
jgi:hypothetical protein